MKKNVLALFLLVFGLSLQQAEAATVTNLAVQGRIAGNYSFDLTLGLNGPCSVCAIESISGTFSNNQESWNVVGLLPNVPGGNAFKNSVANTARDPWYYFSVFGLRFSVQDQSPQEVYEVTLFNTRNYWPGSPISLGARMLIPDPLTGNIFPETTVFEVTSISVSPITAVPVGPSWALLLSGLLAMRFALAKRGKGFLFLKKN